MVLLALSLAIIFVGPSSIEAQTVSLTGVVRDSVTTESLPNAMVTVVGTGRSVLTDEFGRFALVGLPQAEHVIRVEFIGYRPMELDVVNAVEGLTVLLVVDAIQVEGVTVEARGEIVEVSGAPGEVRVSPAQLSALPSIGEPDIFRGLQLLPGVAGTNDASSGLFVRGGTPDENLVLLDGMTVYHVDHFFGVFSAFNSDAIKDVRLFKGGFPAEFGGRTSSVVDLIGKTGDTENFRVSGGVNLLNASAVAEVPLWGRGSWLFSARRSYTDILRSPLYNGIFGTLEGAEESQQTAAAPAPGGRGRGRRSVQQTLAPSFYFYDLNSKLTFLPSDADVLALSLYSGRDNLDESAPSTTIASATGTPITTPQRQDLTEWGNQGVSGRWSRQWSAGFTSDALVAYSRYFSDGLLAVEGGQGARGFDEQNRVGDFTIKVNNEWRPFAASSLRFGAQRTESDVDYDFALLAGETVSRELDLSSSATLTSVFAEHEWRPASWLVLTGGLRTSSYDGLDESYWEPRVSGRAELTDRIAIKGAWGQYSQFVKRIENEDILEGSRDFWVLADSLIPPQTAEHRIAGVSYETPDFLVDLEAYSKSLDGVSQFSTRARTGLAEESEQLFFSGTGEAEGVELLLQRKTGRLTGWVSYTLSRVEYELEGFNAGDPFPASHDQRHELKAVGTYRAGPWVLGATWSYGSGTPYTIPEALYPLTTLDGRELQYIHVGEKNSQRLPAYHRLDVSASRQFESARFVYDLSFSLFNAYGRNNVWYRQFDLSESPMLVTDVATMGFSPSIGLRVATK